jgi:hypothetical protein
MTNMSWKMFLHLHFYINIDIMYCGILLAWSGHEELFLPREREMGKKRFSG